VPDIVRVTDLQEVGGFIDKASAWGWLGGGDVFNWHVVPLLMVNVSFNDQHGGGEGGGGVGADKIDPVVRRGVDARWEVDVQSVSGHSNVLKSIEMFAKAS